MGAPVSVVAAVMEALGCCKVSVEPDPTLARPWCEQHERWWDDRGCPVAVQAADAAWAAAYPEALRDAAERLDWVKPDVCPCDHPEACCGSEEACDAMQPSVRVIGASDLRRWADESGSGRGQD